MTKKIISWLSILTVFLTLFWSCHNEDFAKGETEPQRNNSNFFKHTSKGGINAKSGVDYISILEAYNREKDFLSTMPDQKGMPIWDKMQVLDNGEKTVLYVPLSVDKTDLSSVLIVKVDENNSVFHVQNFTNDYLKGYVYNVDYPKENRKLLMDTFLQMNFFTFGYQEFTNLPKDIYKGSLEYNRLNILDAQVKPEQNKGFIYNTICTTYHYCVHGQSAATCDYASCNCGGLISCFLVTSCTTTATWIDDPFPSFPGGGGGGGGGAPSPEGIPPVDPCSQSGMPFYRISPQCAGGTGNTEITDEELLPPQSPCETLQKMIENSTVKNAIDELKPKTLLDGKEFTQEIERKYNTATQSYEYTTNLREGDSFNAIAATGEFIKGNAHNHPKDGVRIPSLGDIVWLNICQGNIFPANAVAYNIIVCANHLSPTDYTTANLYAIATDNKDELNTKLEDLYNRPDLVGKTDDQKKIKLMNEDDLQYDGLNDNPSELEKKFLQKYGNFGLSLYRFNKTTNKWMKLTTDGNTITETPCE